MLDLLALLRRNPDFRRLLSAAVVSLAGDWFALVAVSGLVNELTGTKGAAAVVLAATVLPVFLAAPLAGVIADRVDRKRMMVTVDLGRIVPALGLLLAVRWGSTPLAIGCVVAIAVMAAFFEPVSAAALPNLVDAEDMSLAQATMGSVWGTMLFVGSAIGGLVAQLFGRETTFIVNAVTFLVSAVLVMGIRRPLRTGPVSAPATVLAHLGEVWAFVKPRKATRALMLTKTGVGIGNGIVGLLPAFVAARFGAGDAAIGLLFAARGLGALIGPFVGRTIGRGDGRRLLLVCGASICSYGIAYAFLPLASSLPVTTICVALAHAGGGAQWVLSTYGLQRTTPDAVRGRVMSLDFGLATLAIGLSALLAGGAVDAFGLRTTSWALVALALVYGGAWLLWTRDLWLAPIDPLALPDQPSPIEPVPPPH
ncbi:MAG: MFS transporter [Egibacteraceae bacterium]